ncbi:MAG TPA: DNA-processing protein DprA [Euzebya sp.]|nr:DNA-processing protein DprA [Euzebya sp.]
MRCRDSETPAPGESRRATTAADSAPRGAAGTSLTDRVAALLAGGVGSDQLGATRRALGMHAGPDAVVTALQRRSGRLPGTGGPPKADPSAGEGPAGGDGLLVAGEGLPPQLVEVWEQGGPLWLHHRGLALTGGPHVAVVGTRRATLDGLTIAEQLGHDLARAGVTVVSGMARGVDQAAHRGALRANGRTIGVLGTGLDVDYPAGSAALRRAVQASGCLVSEYAAGYGIRRRAQFIARNRILVGLSDAVVVVEAGARSGALNSATWATQFNRDVMVVPFSPSNRMATGSLQLLWEGAVLVRDATDVLGYLGLPAVPGTGGPAAVGAPSALASEPAARMLPLLGPTPSTPSALAAATDLSARQVLIGLSELEEIGLARRTPAGVIAAGAPTRARFRLSGPDTTAT